MQSGRKGPTGIGRTLEEWLGVSENNLPIPDIGGRVEIKATRSTTNNLITLFTFNKSAWKQPQADIINRWGYFDEGRDRHALYSTVSASKANSQGLQVILPEGADTISVMDAATEEVLASWDLFHIVGKFMTSSSGCFWFMRTPARQKARKNSTTTRASLLTEPSAQTFRRSFLSGKAFIDIRMHLRSTGSVRNHGTGFRVHEHDLPSLFGKIDSLLGTE